MEKVKIRTNRRRVMDEVAKATDYTGSKLISEADPGARDRILATDDDLAEMGRFWAEAQAAAAEKLRAIWERDEGRGARSEETHEGLWVNVSRHFRRALLPEIERAMESYLVCSILGRWLRYVKPDSAAGYLEEAAAYLNGAERMLYTIDRPTREM